MVRVAGSRRTQDRASTRRDVAPQRCWHDLAPVAGWLIHASNERQRPAWAALGRPSRRPQRTSRRFSSFATPSDFLAPFQLSLPRRLDDRSEVSFPRLSNTAHCHMSTLPRILLTVSRGGTSDALRWTATACHSQILTWHFMHRCTLLSILATSCSFLGRSSANPSHTLQ